MEGKIMKMTCAVMVVLAVLTVNCFGATSLDWGSDSAVGISNTLDIFDSSGGAVEKNSDWYMQLYDISETWNPSDVTAGELVSSTNAFAFVKGVAYVSVQGPKLWGGTTVGTRLFNNSDPTLATLYALGSDQTTLSNLDDPAGGTPESDTYNFGAIGQGDWQAVPEPTVTMLALAGICTVIYRRRRMSR